MMLICWCGFVVVITVLKLEKSESNSQLIAGIVALVAVVITVLKLEKSESNSQPRRCPASSSSGCNHCFKTRKI